VIGEETKAEFRRAARRLFAAHGYLGTTTRMIAIEVGVTPATLHHHFGRKQDLVLSVWRSTMEASNQRLNEAVDARDTFAGKVQAIMEETYESTQRDRDSAMFITSMREEARRTPELTEVVNDTSFADLVRKIVDFGVETKVVSAENAPAVRGAITAVTMGSSFLATDLTPSRVTAVFEGCRRLFDGTLLES
jgi:AcrR family transcriptional regulator